MNGQDVIYSVRLDGRTIAAARQKAAAEGEVLAVIIRQYVKAGLERDGYYVPPGPPKKNEVRYEQRA